MRFELGLAPLFSWSVRLGTRKVGMTAGRAKLVEARGLGRLSTLYTVFGQNGYIAFLGRFELLVKMC